MSLCLQASMQDIFARCASVQCRQVSQWVVWVRIHHTSWWIYQYQQHHHTSDGSVYHHHHTSYLRWIISTTTIHHFELMLYIFLFSHGLLFHGGRFKSRPKGSSYLKDSPLWHHTHCLVASITIIQIMHTVHFVMVHARSNLSGITKYFLKEHKTRFLRKRRN